MSSTPAATKLQVAGVVGFYMSAALVMVFVNKAVLNASPELPLVFLLLQLLIAVVLLHVAALISPRVDLPTLDWQVARKLVPVVAVNIIGLVFNTLCLRDVDASFFQLPLTIAVSALSSSSLPGPAVVTAAVAVTLGFFIGVSPSSLTSLAGAGAPSSAALAYGFLSSLMIALHAVLIKASLPFCHNSTIQLAYWTNAGSAALVLPFVLWRGEVGQLVSMVHAGTQEARVFVWGSAVTGVFGFLLCVAGLLSIKVTSPVTHMFSSAARSVLQTMLGVWIFHDLLTVNRAVSILVILLGTMYYTWVRSGPPPAPKARTVDPEAMARDGEHGADHKAPVIAVFDADEEGLVEEKDLAVRRKS